MGFVPPLSRVETMAVLKCVICGSNMKQTERGIFICSLDASHPKIPKAIGLATLKSRLDAENEKLLKEMSDKDMDDLLFLR